MRDRNGLHVRATAAGVYDMEFFPLGIHSTVEEKGLSAADVVDRILSGPTTVDIRSFDERGRPLNFHEDVRVEMRRRGRDFIPSQPCKRCGDTRVADGRPCPECAVPWAGESRETEGVHSVV